jgi:hypothetical protein
VDGTKHFGRSPMCLVPMPKRLGKIEQPWHILLKKNEVSQHTRF